MTTDIVDVKAALTGGLNELHLPTVRRTYEEAARLAERETLSYERYLLDLITRECEDRQQKRIQRLLRQSRLPAEKALANFNLKRLPPKVALLTKSLIEGEVLDRRENVLAFGNPGSGKTHLLCAIGQELIARGRRIYFTTSALLVQDLLVAKRDLKLSRFIKKLAHFEGLIIDLCGVVSNVELSAGSPASGHSGGAQLHISMELQRFEPVEDRAVSAPRQTGTVRDWLDPSNSLSFHL